MVDCRWDQQPHLKNETRNRKATKATEKQQKEKTSKKTSAGSDFEENERILSGKNNQLTCSIY
jgi:hypothetical protein